MIRMHVLSAALGVACLGILRSAVAQTVIAPDPPPARADTTQRADTAPPDTTRVGSPPPAAAPAPPPLPAPAPPQTTDAPPREVCGAAAPGEAAPDVLGVVFEADAPIEARAAALAAVSGKRLAGAVDDQLQYLQVPAGGSEFRLRTFADKLIRLRGVSEVGPVICPAPPAQPTRPVRPDSASS